MMIIQKAFVNENHEAVVTCALCGEERIVNVAKYKKHNNRIVAKCSCGFAFLVTFIYLDGRDVRNHLKRRPRI